MPLHETVITEFATTDPQAFKVAVDELRKGEVSKSIKSLHSNNGWNLLQNAIFWNNRYGALFLIDQEPALLNQVSADGATALDVALLCHHSSLAQMILLCGGKSGLMSSKQPSNKEKNVLKISIVGDEKDEKFSDRDNNLTQPLLSNVRTSSEAPGVQKNTLSQAANTLAVNEAAKKRLAEMEKQAYNTENILALCFWCIVGKHNEVLRLVSANVASGNKNLFSNADIDNLHALALVIDNFEAITIITAGYHSSPEVMEAAAFDPASALTKRYQQYAANSDSQQVVFNKLRKLVADKQYLAALVFFNQLTKVKEMHFRQELLATMVKSPSSPQDEKRNDQVLHWVQNYAGLCLSLWAGSNVSDLIQQAIKENNFALIALLFNEIDILSGHQKNQEQRIHFLQKCLLLPEGSKNLILLNALLAFYPFLNSPALVESRLNIIISPVTTATSQEELTNKQQMVVQVNPAIMKVFIDNLVPIISTYLNAEMARRAAEKEGSDQQYSQPLKQLTQFIKLINEPKSESSKLQLLVSDDLPSVLGEPGKQKFLAAKYATLLSAMLASIVTVETQTLLNQFLNSSHSLLEDIDRTNSNESIFIDQIKRHVEALLIPVGPRVDFHWFYSPLDNMEQWKKVKDKLEKWKWEWKRDISKLELIPQIAGLFSVLGPINREYYFYNPNINFHAQYITSITDRATIELIESSTLYDTRSLQFFRPGKNDQEKSLRLALLRHPWIEPRSVLSHLLPVELQSEVQSYLGSKRVNLLGADYVLLKPVSRADDLVHLQAILDQLIQYRNRLQPYFTRSYLRYWWQADCNAKLIPIIFILSIIAVISSIPLWVINSSHEDGNIKISAELLSFLGSMLGFITCILIAASREIVDEQSTLNDRFGRSQAFKKLETFDPTLHQQLQIFLKQQQVYPRGDNVTTAQIQEAMLALENQIRSNIDSLNQPKAAKRPEISDEKVAAPQTSAPSASKMVMLDISDGKSDGKADEKTPLLRLRK